MRVASAIALSLIATTAQAQLHPDILAVNPASLISIQTVKDIEDLRDDLAALVQANPAPLQFQSIYPHMGNGTYAAAVNLKEISIWMVPQGIGTYAPVWRFKPTTYRPNGKCALILHGGHGHHASWPPFQSLLLKTVEAGCEVAAVDMPFNGLSPMTIRLPVRGGGFYSATAHEDFAYVDRPLSLFVEPALSVLDTMEGEGVNNIAMAGLSGGGWTTTLVAAMDDRVDISYSISGSMPAYMRSWVLGSKGDWEQSYLSAAGFEYLDLYVLAASGRKARNVYIVNDPCCFSGMSGGQYSTAVQAAVTASGGGNYATHFDSTSVSHTISNGIRDIIVNEMKADF